MQKAREWDYHSTSLMYIKDTSLRALTVSIVISDAAGKSSLEDLYEKV